ncbi:MAG: DUF1134 domain-containing protein [Hyphomicrobium sp.]|nr:DUF1134 domain-containing protein [Hyphomicrobium sp.]
MDRPMALPTGKPRYSLLVCTLAMLCAGAISMPSAQAQDSAYGPYSGGRTGNDAYVPPANDPPPIDPTPSEAPYRPGGAYSEGDNYRRYDNGREAAAPPEAAPGYGEPYHAPGEYDGPRADGPPRDDGYSQNEIIDAGGRFFGSVSKGLASVVEYAFQKSGRPNGYILGTDAGGAFVAGLRYGEGTLYTRDAGSHRVFWQGPSIGYDFGGEGSKTMVLVYNLRDPSQIYERYGGVQGSAYIIGGVGIQYQTHGNVTLAPIRSGIGLRLGANVGYLKYTRSPTWNPF